MDITDNQLNTLNNKIKSIQTKNVNDDNILLTKQLNEITASINIIKSSILEVETRFNCIKNKICIQKKNKDNTKKDNNESTLKLKKQPKHKIVSNKHIVKLDSTYIDFLSLESDEIEIKILNCKLNAYLTANKLIKDKYVILNKPLKTLLKTRKQKIYIDDILNYVKYEVK